MSNSAQPAEWHLDDLIPHRDSMQLLSRILAADASCLWASARTNRSCSNCWGIEYLGQATAAFFTLAQHGQAADKQMLDQAPAMGMLIGSRSYQAHQPALRANQELLIQVTLKTPATSSLVSAGLVKFAGRMWDLPSGVLESLPLSTTNGRLPYDTKSLAEFEGELLAQGDLSVYIPPQQPPVD